MRATRKMPMQGKTTQQDSTTTTLPRINGEEDYTIDEAWINLVQAEDYLVRGITAFLPRIKQEETNLTFKHPENWDQLNLQEKANLIIIDNIIKLIGLQECKNTTEYNGNEVHAVSSPSLLGRGPSTAPEDEGYSYPDDHTRIGQRYGPFRSIPTGLVTYPTCCPD